MTADAPVAGARQRAAATTAVPVAATRLRWTVWVGALVALASAATLGTLVGAAGLSWHDVAAEVLSRVPGIDLATDLTSRDQAILWQLRIPRVVLGGLVGATLASAGAAYQGVFRNPLADPYLLGAAAGAGLGATLTIAYSPVSGRALLPLAAFVGAMAGVMLAYALGRSSMGRSTSSLVLAGVAVASFLTAVQTYVMQRESDTLREVYAWILGQLGTAGWGDVRRLLPYATISAVVIVLHRRLLDVLAVGEHEAGTLGVRADRVRLVVVAAASLGTAAAVAVSGLIGFVGIIVPHTIRLLVGASYRVVLPLSLVFGATFMILADLLARTVAAPAELPIGVVTAFFGAPFFALVLRTSRQGVTT